MSDADDQMGGRGGVTGKAPGEGDPSQTELAHEAGRGKAAAARTDGRPAADEDDTEPSRTQRAQHGQHEDGDQERNQGK